MFLSYVCVKKLYSQCVCIVCRQEAPLLERVEVTVQLGSGEKLQCQAYTMSKEEKDELPSPAYLKTIVTGAREHGLPEEYIRNTFLCVQNNGYRE